MGMFSWLCKGCGQGLINGELCRLDGCKGEYDGYGHCGNFDYQVGSGRDRPTAWHQACYQKATPDQKLDETPSKPAPDQGCSPAHLAFLPGYDPQAETKYTVSYETWNPNLEDEDIRDCQWFITPDGPQDQTAFDKARRKALVGRIGGGIVFGRVSTSSVIETAEAYEDLDRRFANPPENNATQFATFAEAKQVAEAAIESTPEYVIIIYGLQSKVRGMVYRHDRHENIKDWYDTKKSKTPGNPDEVDWTKYHYERLGTYTDEVVYDQAPA